MPNTGVFLREIASRLTKGLTAEIPDLQERVDHILTKRRLKDPIPPDGEHRR